MNGTGSTLTSIGTLCSIYPQEVQLLVGSLKQKLAVFCVVDASAGGSLYSILHLRHEIREFQKITV